MTGRKNVLALARLAASDVAEERERACEAVLAMSPGALRTVLIETLLLLGEAER